MKNKRADGGLTAIIIILIIVVFLGWIVNINQRECSSNKDCGNDRYCGSDFSCHDFPAAEKISGKVSYTLPVLMICITAIIITMILKGGKLPKRKAKENNTEKVKENKVENTKETKSPETF